MNPTRPPVLAAALVLLLVGVPLPSAAAQAQPATTERSAPADSLAARLDALFAEWDRPGSPGAALAVVRDGEVVYTRGYGLANLEYDIPISPSSVFHIASVSKHFTAFAIGLLAQEGKLSLDDDIRSHLPEVPDFGRTVTIRHLIHHTGGLRDQWELLAMAGWRLDDVITRDHILTMVANQKELNFEPGDEHLYSNTGYTLMAEIVARVSGESFREFTAKRIFEPLGMSSTHFHDDHQMIVPNRAYSYALGPSGGYRSMPLNYANVGATSLFTTVEDLAKWERNFYSYRVGGEALLQEMTTRGVLNDGKEIPYAHALVWGEYRGLRTIGHGGADAGYRTAYLRFPDQRLAVIVFSNLASFNPGRLAQQVAEVYLEREMKPSSPQRERRAASRRVRVPEAELAARAGLYANPANDQLRRLEMRDGRLTLVTGPGYELSPVARDRFAIVAAPSEVEIRFEASGDGRAGLRMLEVVDGGEPTVYEPVRALAPTQLEEFAGRYYSEELGTTYDFVVKDGALTATHRRHQDTRLTPTFRDRFAGESWWFRRAEFTRDESGEIDGFRLTGGRVRNLRFDKLPG